MERCCQRLLWHRLTQQHWRWCMDFFLYWFLSEASSSNQSERVKGCKGFSKVSVFNKVSKRVKKQPGNQLINMTFDHHTLISSLFIWMSKSNRISANTEVYDKKRNAGDAWHLLQHSMLHSHLQTSLIFDFVIETVYFCLSCNSHGRKCITFTAL